MHLFHHIQSARKWMPNQGTLLHLNYMREVDQLNISFRKRNAQSLGQDDAECRKQCLCAETNIVLLWCRVH